MSSLTAENVKVGDNLPTLEKKLNAQKIISAAAATRDWQPIHHDHPFATEKSGLRDIILNAPSQAGWISRYVTDWAGPDARLKKLGFKMKDSFCPGDLIRLEGEVVAVEDGDECGTWIDLQIDLFTEDKLKTSAEVRVAIPSSVENQQQKRAMPWHCPNEVWLAS